ncbi:MAG: hypothetical protein ABIP14_06855 [Blastocatellia bacterium]
MFKGILVILLALCCLSGAACSDNGAKNTAQPALTFATPTPEPKVVYAQGFFDQEGTDGGTWRWMGPEGVVRLKNGGHDMTLTFAGSSPMHVFKSPVTIKLTFNGMPLDQFTGKAEGVEKRYEIPSSKLGSGDFSELRISSDKSMVPHEVDKTLQDSRRLALSLSKLKWEEK